MDYAITVYYKDREKTIWLSKEAVEDDNPELLLLALRKLLNGVTKPPVITKVRLP
jgi:hypothetical protein